MSLLIKMLPFVFKFLNYIFDKTNASNETKEQMFKLIAATAKDGLISVEAKDIFKAQKEEIMKELEK